MSTLLILGTGGHALSVADAALALGHWDSLAFLDDEPKETILGFPVLGRLAAAEVLRDGHPEAFVALGNNALRLAWLEKLRGWGFKIPSVIHPRSIVSPFAEIGEGCVVMAGAVVNVKTVIHEGCILNTGCGVDHNSILGAGVHLSPGVHAGGDTFIGTRTWICIGATIGSQRSICADSIIAAGAAVVSDITEPGLYAGVPAVKKQGELDL